MTSKEALENIGMTKTNNIKSESLSKPRVMYLVKELRKKEIQIIKKDFEVLEILKRHSTRLDDEDWNDNIFNGIDYENLDEKERKIIKEWLENDDK